MKKTIYKRWWFWVVILVLAGAVAVGGSRSGTEVRVIRETPAAVRSVPAETASAQPKEGAETSAPATEVQPITAIIAAPASGEAAERTGAAAPAPTPAPVTVPVHGTDRDVTLPSGTEVWIPATGVKFHKKSKCGNMNPDKAQKITVDEARSRGYEACENCY